MKVFAIILSVVLAIGIIGFGVTAAAYGFNNKPFQVSSASDSTTFQDYDTEQNFDYDQKIDEIEINTVSCDVRIEKSSDDQTHVTYSSFRSAKFSSTLKNGKLKIEEDPVFIISFFSCSNMHSTLTIELAETEIDSFTFNNVSGDLSVVDLISDDLNINTTSGTINFDGYGNNINIYSISGDTIFTNTTDKKSKSLTVNTTSGDYYFKDVMPEKTKVNSTSGDYNFEGLTGKVEISSMSGSYTLSYSEWNDDLKIDSTSGDYNILLPEGSGANVKFNAISGELRSNLDGNRVDINNKTSKVEIGGSNKQEIEIYTTSGDYVVENN